MNSKKDLVDIYRDRYVKEGNSPKGFFWNDAETQNLRFDKILSMIPREGSHRVHDVGCGTGHFDDFARQQGFDIQYSGCEIVPEMVADFKETRPTCEVKEGLFLDIDYGPEEKYDFLVVSGLFNLPGDQEEQWQSQCEEVLSKMWGLAEKGVIVNFLTSYSTFYSDDLHYANPGWWLDFCHKNLSRFVKVDHAYPLFEFTLGVFRPEFIREQHPQPAYDKYFK